MEQESQDSQLPHKFFQTLTLEHEQSIESNHGDDNVDDDEDDDNASIATVSTDFEFSFAGAGDAARSPVSAEEIFHNGQIRPTLPPFGSSGEATTSYAPPVRKLFVKSSPERDDIAEGPYSAAAEKSPAPVPAMSKKSNSTGFSKLWRFRDLLVRSHSDGKDAFVFLTENSSEISPEKKKGKKREEAKKAEKKKKVAETASSREKKKKVAETASYKEKSVYEVLYGKREKEKKAGKGKGKSSYLPYKQDLVGFFTNASGMSRNVHPY